MKTLEFNKNSWHYSLASMGSKSRVNSDICGYGRQMLGGACIIIVLLLICAGVLFFVGTALGEIVAAIVTGVLLSNSIPDFLVFVCAFGTIVFTTYYLCQGVALGSKKVYNSTSIFSAIKEAHDNKICLPIKFKGEEK
jgi:hypothetical protein